MPRRRYAFEASGVRIAYERRARNLWSRVTLRKAQLCVCCDSAMAPGREAFRPLTERGSTVRDERACLACVLPAEVAEQGEALGDVRTFHLMRGDVIRAVVESRDRYSFRCITCAESSREMDTGEMCEHARAVREFLQREEGS